jgi:alpha-D-xyloside xylohydrolase
LLRAIATAICLPSVMVVDWFYYTKMGQIDLRSPQFWPDPSAMNKQLHEMGFETMISVWPSFVPDDRYYAELRQKGWLIHRR